MECWPGFIERPEHSRGDGGQQIWGEWTSFLQAKCLDVNPVGPGRRCREAQDRGGGESWEGECGPRTQGRASTFSPCGFRANSPSESLRFQRMHPRVSAGLAPFRAVSGVFGLCGSISSCDFPSLSLPETSRLAWVCREHTACTIVVGSLQFTV